MDDGSDAIAWSKTLPRSDSSSGSNTTPWGDDIDATSPSMRAGHFENSYCGKADPGMAQWKRTNDAECNNEHCVKHSSTDT